MGKFIDYDGPGAGWVATGKGFIRVEDGGLELLAENAMQVETMMQSPRDDLARAERLLVMAGEDYLAAKPDHASAEQRESFMWACWEKFKQLRSSADACRPAEDSEPAS